LFAIKSELLEKIRLGEDSYLELKSVHFAGDKVSGPSQNDLADELAAFANSAGGVLVLGVEDKSRKITGIALERLDAVEARVREACQDSVMPPLFPVIERLTLPDDGGHERPVIRVDVPRSLFVHQSPKGYWYRVGSSKRILPPDQLARLFQQRSQSRLIRFDETPVMPATLVDLDEALWRRFVPKRGFSSAFSSAFAHGRQPSSQQGGGAPEIPLGKLAMAARDEGGGWHPTVAGLLMGSSTPERFLPCAFIQAVAYRGTNIAPSGESIYQLDAKDMTGPLDRQILDACAFVRRNMRVAAYKREQGGRVDVPQFDMQAVFEAVANAVAHRDYSMGGSKVRMRLFDDRLELYTPGMLPNTMTPEDLLYRQAARNEAITSLLARCPIDDGELAPHRQHIMDKRGEGVPIILNQSNALAGRMPEYRLIGEAELLLTMYAANPGLRAERL
jgi:predicted HTH transcriptional regulator